MTIQQHASFDSSAAELNATSKLVKAWESKNAKNAAKAGGISLMALSLAACGGSDSTTTASTDTAATDTAATDAAATDTAATDTTATVTAVSEALTAAKLAYVGTTGADTFTGSTSGTAASNTLQATTVIDGAAGDDSLTVTLDANFASTADVGSIAGIEELTLINEGTAARSFNASEATGFTSIVLDGGTDTTNAALTVTNVVASAPVDLTVQDLSSGTMTMTYSASSLTGTADAQTITVSNLGTADSSASTAASNAVNVAIVTSATEKVTVDSTGTTTNLVNLAGTTGSELTLTGATAIGISAINTGVTTIDGSDATAAISVNTLNAATNALSSVKTGTGADTVTVRMGDITSATTTVIDGGTGSDTLSLSGVGSTVTAQFQNIETVSAAGMTGTGTITLATGSTGFDTVALVNPTNAATTFAGTLVISGDTGSLALNATGVHGGTVRSNDSTSLTMALAPETANAATAITTAVTANSATSIDLTTTGTATTYTGIITSAAATSLTVNSAGALTLGAPVLSSLTTLDVTTAGAFVYTPAILGATTITLGGSTGTATITGALGSAVSNAALNITATDLSGGLTLANGADAGLKTLTVDVSGMQDNGAIDLATAGALNGDVAVVVNAAGTIGTLDTGVMTGGTVTLNAAGSVGLITTGAITADTAATLTYGNTATSTDVITHGAAGTLTVTKTGTSGVDGTTVNGIAGTTSIVVSGNQGGGTDTFAIDGSAATAAQTITLSATNYATSTITGSGVADTITGGTGIDTIASGIGADSITGGAGADIFQFAVADIFGADGAAVADTISDFVVGTDTLQFTAITDIVSAQQAAVQVAVTALTAGSTDAQVATAMALANTTDLGVSIATFEGNTFVYVETVGATATHDADANIFVELTGVTTIPTFANDIIA